MNLAVTGLTRQFLFRGSVFTGHTAAASAGRSTMVLGCNIDRIERNIESIESKFAKIFKRPKNREDGSNCDDFWTESIVSTQSIFSKISNEQKMIEPIESIDSIGWSIDRIDCWPPCSLHFPRLICRMRKSISRHIALRSG